MKLGLQAVKIAKDLQCWFAEKEKKQMIKVLHILSALDGGGVESMLMSYYRYMDKEKIQFDFMVHGSKIGIMEKMFSDMGSVIYHVVPKKESYFKNLRQATKIIKEGKYDVVHCHQDYHGAEVISIAKRLGVKNIVSHSHIAYVPENMLSKMRRYISSKIVIKKATHYAACTNDAARWLFGKRADNGEVTVVRNAIQPDKFDFDAKVRESKRKQLNIEDKIVIGNVGRFAVQKNHTFLIDIFSEIKKINTDTVLLLVGDGPLQVEIEKKVLECQLGDSVIFLGARDDVPELMQAMDVFLFPSKFEGLGIVLIEAQAAGLGCVISDKIPVDVLLTEKMRVLSLEKSAKIWAETTMEVARMPRESQLDSIIQGRYDIRREYKALEDFYIQMH